MQYYVEQEGSFNQNLTDPIDLESMIQHELINSNIENKNILILGNSGYGKTTFLIRF
jgi:predicted NACHT family NTPase